MVLLRYKDTEHGMHPILLCIIYRNTNAWGFRKRTSRALRNPDDCELRDRETTFAKLIRRFALKHGPSDA